MSEDLRDAENGGSASSTGKEGQAIELRREQQLVQRQAELDLQQKEIQLARRELDIERKELASRREVEGLLARGRKSARRVAATWALVSALVGGVIGFGGGIVADSPTDTVATTETVAISDDIGPISEEEILWILDGVRLGRVSPERAAREIASRIENRTGQTLEPGLVQDIARQLEPFVRTDVPKAIRSEFAKQIVKVIVS